MKMSPQDFAALKSVVKLAKGATMRQRWDALFEHGCLVKQLYDAGLNDAHIDTALRAIADHCRGDAITDLERPGGCGAARNPIEAGTVIQGTLRTRDLVQALMTELKRITSHPGNLTLADEAHAWLAGAGVEADGNELCDDLFNLLNEHAPEGMYFGAHEGDGADFGWWYVETFECERPGGCGAARLTVETVTLPESWACALINGDMSGMDDADIKALEAWQRANPTYEVVDVVRDSEGNGDEGRFTWSYDLYGGTARGGDVLDYVVHVRETYDVERPGGCGAARMVVQAITTRFLGPTNVRGSRIKAKAAAGSVTVGYDHALNSEDNHLAAALALVDKLGWRELGEWHQGGLPDDRGYCFVCAK